MYRVRLDILTVLVKKEFLSQLQEICLEMLSLVMVHVLFVYLFMHYMGFLFCFGDCCLYCFKKGHFSIDILEIAESFHQG